LSSRSKLDAVHVLPARLSRSFCSPRRRVFRLSLDLTMSTKAEDAMSDSDPQPRILRVLHGM
jgi:hypothetical protein